MRLPRRALPALLPPLALAPRAAVRSEIAAGRALRPDANRPPRGASAALLWLHAHYTEGPPPDPPPFADRLIGPGWDLWRLDRVATADAQVPVRDPLDAGAAALAAACTTLRVQGYRRIAVVGESRGAFIALWALRLGLAADALLALAPAAHGTRAERRPQALADFQAALQGWAGDDPHRLGVVLFAGDPYDPDPDRRAAAVRDAAAAHRGRLLLVDRPPAPTGHGGARDPAFDRLFGAELARFLAGQGPG